MIKRSSFLRLLMVASSMLIAPATVLAKRTLKFRVDKGFKVDAGKDRFDKSLSLFGGDTFDCKISTEDTDGDMYIFESRRTIKGGPALHFHYDQDEWWYVLQGEFLIKVGEVTYHAKAGDSVFGPRKVPHTFAKVGEGEGKLLMIFQPAGKMEACFKKISEGATSNMSEEERDEFRKEHGFERVGPPLTYLKQ